MNAKPSAMKHYTKYLLLLGLITFLGRLSAYSQNDIFVNLAPVDGVDLTPDNLLSYQIQSNLKKRTHALVQGTIRYRNSDMRISYRFEYDLQPGVNMLSANALRPQYDYSSVALKELFELYKKLPQGIYEYCVAVKPDYNVNETVPGPVYDECVYHKSEDIFLIDLVDPGNDAKIYEYNPMLNWAVNYPFASELTYRLRVTEIKQGQNTAAAISRNNPVYEERNLRQLSQIYPVYGKPLQKNQPYAWTVDAYYKGILLGGAEPWKFTIIEDSLLNGLPHESYFVDIRKEKDAAIYYAVGKLKLKYVLDEKLQDVLTVSLTTKSGNVIKLKEKTLTAVQGDNRYEIDLKEEVSLTHLGNYQFTITNEKGEQFILPVKYINPDYL